MIECEVNSHLRFLAALAVSLDDLVAVDMIDEQFRRRFMSWNLVIVFCFAKSPHNTLTRDSIVALGIGGYWTV